MVGDALMWKNEDFVARGMYNFFRATTCSSSKYNIKNLYHNNLYIQLISILTMCLIFVIYFIIKNFFHRR